MVRVDTPLRTELLQVRMRQAELAQAMELARAQEVKLPELVRRLLAEAYKKVQNAQEVTA
jgi:hypothetical protein